MANKTYFLSSNGIDWGLMPFSSIEAAAEAAPRVLHANWPGATFGVGELIGREAMGGPDMSPLFPDPLVDADVIYEFAIASMEAACNLARFDWIIHTSPEQDTALEEEIAEVVETHLRRAGQWPPSRRIIREVAIFSIGKEGKCEEKKELSSSEVDRVEAVLRSKTPRSGSESPSSSP